MYIYICIYIYKSITNYINQSINHQQIIKFSQVET